MLSGDDDEGRQGVFYHARPARTSARRRANRSQAQANRFQALEIVSLFDPASTGEGEGIHRGGTFLCRKTFSFLKARDREKERERASENKREK